MGTWGRLAFVWLGVWHLLCVAVWADPPDQRTNPEGWQIWQKAKALVGAKYQHWEDNRDHLLPRVLLLADRALAAAKPEQDRLGEADFLKAVDQNDFTQDDELGKSELTLVDRTPIVKVLHPESELSFLVIDANQLDPSSKHLKKLIGRQHFDSGKNRTDGKVGRDVVLIWRDGKEILDTIYLSKPWMFSPRWWAEYAQAVVRKPTKAHIGLGTACAIAQTGLALCVAATKQWLDPGSDFQYEPAILSAVFGMVLGINVKTYKTWCLLGSKISQITKSSMVSLAFAYSLAAWTDGMGGWDLFDQAFWFAQFHILSNAFFNNWAKIEWHQINKIREENRLNTRPFHVYWPGKGWVETGVSWSDVEHQAVYLIPFTLRLGDLTKVAIPFEQLGEAVPGITALFGDGLPLGKALLYASIPAAQYMVLKYAESRELQGAERLRARFENIKRKTKVWLLGGPLAATQLMGALVGTPVEPFQALEMIDYVKTKAGNCVRAIARALLPEHEGSSP